MSCSTYFDGLWDSRVLTKAASSTIFESLVWLDLGIPDHWRTHYSLGQWPGIYKLLLGQKKIHIFHVDICLNVEVIAWLEFELTYYDVPVQHFSHYTKRTRTLNYYGPIIKSVECSKLIFVERHFRSNGPDFNKDLSLAIRERIKNGLDDDNRIIGKEKNKTSSNTDPKWV